MLGENAGREKYVGRKREKEGNPNAYKIVSWKEINTIFFKKKKC